MGPSNPVEHMINPYGFALMLIGVVLHKSRQHGALDLSVTHRLAMSKILDQLTFEVFALHAISPGHGMAIRERAGRSSFA